MYFSSGQIDEGGVESGRAGGRADDYGQVLGFSAPSLPLYLAPSLHQHATASLRTGVAQSVMLFDAGCRGRCLHCEDEERQEELLPLSKVEELVLLTVW
jgi:hypothetical protein